MALSLYRHDQHIDIHSAIYKYTRTFPGSGIRVFPDILKRQVDGIGMIEVNKWESRLYILNSFIELSQKNPFFCINSTGSDGIIMRQNPLAQ